MKPFYLISSLILAAVLAGCQHASGSLTLDEPSVDGPEYTTEMPVQRVALADVESLSPQYSIEYRYASPESLGGQSCTAQCETHYKECLLSQDDTLCQEEYHSCYRLCGGRVEQIRRCVTNCDESDLSD